MGSCCPSPSRPEAPTTARSFIRSSLVPASFVATFANSSQMWPMAASASGRTRETDTGSRSSSIRCVPPARGAWRPATGSSPRRGTRPHRCSPGRRSRPPSARALRRVRSIAIVGATSSFTHEGTPHAGDDPPGRPPRRRVGARKRQSPGILRRWRRRPPEAQAHPKPYVVYRAEIAGFGGSTALRFTSTSLRLWITPVVAPLWPRGRGAGGPAGHQLSIARLRPGPRPINRLPRWRRIGGPAFPRSARARRESPLPAGPTERRGRPRSRLGFQRRTVRARCRQSRPSRLPPRAWRPPRT